MTSLIPRSDITTTYNPLRETPVTLDIGHSPGQHQSPIVRVDGETFNTDFLLSPTKRGLGQSGHGFKRMKANHYAYRSGAPSASTGRILSQNEAAKKRRATSQRKCGQCRQPGHTRAHPMCPGTPPAEVTQVAPHYISEAEDQDSEYASV